MFNNGLSKRAVRPELGPCAEQLIFEQASAENRVIQVSAGLPLKEVRNVQLLTQSLRNCFSTYNIKPLKDYLRGIAFNFQFSYVNVGRRMKGSAVDTLNTNGSDSDKVLLLTGLYNL